jgi:hypothetical protein
MLDNIFKASLSKAKGYQTGCSKLLNKLILILGFKELLLSKFC